MNQSDIASVESQTMSDAESRSIGKNYAAVGCAVVVLVAFGVSVWTVWREVSRIVRRSEIEIVVNGVSEALREYHDEHGEFPPAVAMKEGGHPRSWRSMIGVQTREYREDQPWDGSENQALAELHGWAAQCQRMGYGIFAVRGDNTVWPDSEAVSAHDVIDGTSATVLLVVVPVDDFNWFEPKDLVWNGERLVFEKAPGAVVEFTNDRPGMLVTVNAGKRWINSTPESEVLGAIFGRDERTPVDFF